MAAYKDFLNSKRIKTEFTGFDPCDLNPGLFDFQKDVVTWSCRKGKAALFEDCGLGKTIQQLSWANQVHNHTSGNILILAPLAVSVQTQREGEKFGISVNIARNQDSVAPGINITNYEMLDHFNPELFSGVVLDESSILKNYSGKIRNTIIQKFRDTPFKLACTATPSPNDLMELGNHAEFLTDVTRSEMLAMFFVHDSGDTGKWRLKKHAEREFWEWICTWAVMLRNPQEIGYNQCDYNLPALNIIDGCIQTDIEVPEKMGLNARRKVRRATIRDRCELAASIVNYSEGPFIVWCDLNDESAMLNEMIHGAVEIRGTHKPEYKEQNMVNFSQNKIKALITKPKIAGLGMNWQNCSNQIFVGLSDSYEQYYQAVRRCWRFGQTKPVNVHIVYSDKEGAVVENIRRKERMHNDMFESMVNSMQPISGAQIRQESIKKEYAPTLDIQLPFDMMENK